MLFILTYWKQAVLAVLLCATLYYKCEYNNAVAELATFKAEIATATAKQEADNAINLAKAKGNVNVAVNQASADMARLNLDRTQSTNEMKKLYETKIANLKHSMDDRLQSSTDNHSSTTIETASDTSTIAEGGGERDTAFATLEKACTIETIDYNLLRTWADEVCSIAVCE